MSIAPVNPEEDVGVSGPPLELEADDELEANVLHWEKILKECVEKHGELAPECANAYYSYGNALLAKARSDSDILGKQTEALSKEKGIQNGVNYDEEDEDEEGEEEEEEEEEENEGDNVNESVVESSSADANVAEEGNPDGEVLDNEANKSEGKEELKEDLEFAWEALETARVIFDKQGLFLEKVDAIIALCEVSLEKEDFSTCIQDYHECLAVLKSVLEPDSRRIAEIWFRMCMAHQLANEAKEAMECCRNAINVCQSRLNRLKSQSIEASSASCKPDNPKAEGCGTNSEVSPELSLTKSSVSEIEELKLLIQDLEEKEEEIKEMSLLPPLSDAMTEVAEKRMKGESSSKPESIFKEPATNYACSSSEAKAITDLGVLGRGIKRVSDSPSVSLPNGNAPPSKKRNLEDVIGGDGSTEGFAPSKLP